MWLGAVVLLLAFFAAPKIAATCTQSPICGLGDGALTQAGLRPAVDELATDLVPDVHRALEQLYNTTARLDASTLRISDTEIAKLWFAQSFQDASGEYFVVFGQIQGFEGDLDYLRCHACTASIGQITYKKLENKDWKIISLHKNIGKTGSWGAAPDIDHADIHHISKASTWLLSDRSYTGNGETSDFMEIISFKNHQWHFLGEIMTSEDNYGSCSDNPEERDDAGYHPCRELKAISIAYIQGDAIEYPEIFVAYNKKTDHQNDMNTIAASVRYLFDGANYKPVTDILNLFPK